MIRIVTTFSMLGYLACILTTIEVQAQYLNNPSLEGEPGTDAVPPGWATGDTWSNPNFYDASQFDPTQSGNFYAPVDGITFALFRARGATYAESFFAPYQREYLYQELIQPLETNSCFKISVWMCSNPAHQVMDTEYPDTALPLKFQVWGGVGPNTRTELLVDSDPIRNTTWNEFNFYFSTQDISYPYLLIEVQWDTINIFSRAYNGYILVDFLHLEYLCLSDTIAIEDTLYYRGDNEMTITPVTAGTIYKWEPRDVVSDPTAQSPVITEFTDDLLVYVYQENDCPVIEKYHLILDCDTMYPARINDTVSFYYKYEDNLQLSASSDGTAWHWQPEEYVSYPDIQSPYLLGFVDSLEVRITDRYGCEFVDLFNIIWNCDTVYPGGRIMVLDTTLNEEDLINETEFELRPLFGTAPFVWNTTLYMDCMDCIYPTVAPPSTITYSADLQDEFGCEHTEEFHFEVPFRIPNAITPNGDGVNDCFLAYGLPPGTTFLLFDKIGNVLCEINDFEALEDCWKGIDNSGKELKTGTYWYAFVNKDSGTLAQGFLFIKR